LGVLEHPFDDCWNRVIFEINLGSLSALRSPTFLVRWTHHIVVDLDIDSFRVIHRLPGTNIPFIFFRGYMLLVSRM